MMKMRRDDFINKYPGRWSAAPRDTPLPLLSFDPGGVWQALPRRACPDVGKDTRCAKACQSKMFVERWTVFNILEMKSKEFLYLYLHINLKSTLWRHWKWILGRELIEYLHLLGSESIMIEKNIPHASIYLYRCLIRCLQKCFCIRLTHNYYELKWIKIVPSDVKDRREDSESWFGRFS